MSDRFRAPEAGERASARAGDVRAVGMPAWAGLGAGVVLAVAVFLPWYALNIAPPFSAGSASGWRWTVFAQIAMGLGVITAGASAAQVLDARGVLSLQRSQRVALAWTAMVCAVIAAVLVGFRLVVMPDPADLLSRQIGIYLAMAAAVVAVLAALGQIATQDVPGRQRRRR